MPKDEVEEKECTSKPKDEPDNAGDDIIRQ
jgi:hypothetical protein